MDWPENFDVSEKNVGFKSLQARLYGWDCGKYDGMALAIPLSLSIKGMLIDKLHKGFDFALQNQMIIFSFLFAAEPQKAGFRGLRAATRAPPLEPAAFEKAGETLID